MKVIVNCDHCGKPYEKDIKKVNYNQKINNKNYCSRECFAAAKTQKIEMPCSCCGKIIKVDKSRLEKSKSGHVFCNRSCSTSYNNQFKNKENSPNWDGGKSTYRQRAIEHYGAVCSVCGYNIEEVLEVHHKDSNRKNNKIENLDVLCPTHHKEYQLGILKYNGV